MRATSPHRPLSALFLFLVAAATSCVGHEIAEEEAADDGHGHSHRPAVYPPPGSDELELRRQGLTTYPAIDFNPRPGYHANNWIGLSFDDGPDLANTPRVLDILAQKGARATFFINTLNWDGGVEGNTTLKNTIKRIVNEGHVLGSHTHRHLDLANQTASTIESEITEVQRIVNRSDVLGSSFPKITLLRAPFGSPYVSEGPGGAGYEKVAPIVARYAVHIGWAIDTLDWNCSGTATQKRDCVINAFKNHVKTPGVGEYGQVLMHSVQPQTADALPAIIDYAVQNGFVFKSAEDMVRAQFGKSSHEVIYGVPGGGTGGAGGTGGGAGGAGGGTGCTQTPFGGAPRGVPGTIQAEDFDSGGQGCAYHDTTTGNSGNQYRTAENVDIQVTTDTGGGHNIGWVVGGEWLEYTVNVGTAGTFKPELRVSTTTTGKTIDLLIDGVLVGNDLPVPNTGSYQTFATISAPNVNLTAGSHLVRVLFNTSSQNFNWLRFSSVVTCTPESNAAFCTRLGKNCGTVSGTDNCGAPRSVSSCGTCTSPQVCGATNVCQTPSASSYFYFEAENGAGAATAPMSVGNDASASAGKYTWSATSSSNSAVPSNGRVKFTFNVTTAGTYKVWGRFLVGPSTSSDDSLWSRIDTSTFIQWNDIYPRVGNAGYQWDAERNTASSNALVTRTLSVGTHTLEIAYRENGLKMDRFLVTNDLTFVPSP